MPPLQTSCKSKTLWVFLMFSWSTFRMPLWIFSTTGETPSGAKILPTTLLVYSNLMGIANWGARAAVNLVAGIAESFGQIPLYSKSWGSTSCDLSKMCWLGIWKGEWLLLLIDLLLPSAVSYFGQLGWRELWTWFSVQLLPNLPQEDRWGVMLHTCTRRSYRQQIQGLWTQFCPVRIMHDMCMVILELYVRECGKIHL